MNCEMCGISTKLVLANIEGATVNVCNNCSKLGKIVNLPKSKPAKQVFEEPEIYVVENFSTLIRNAREKLNLKQEEVARKLAIKESIIHKLENGSFTPSLNMASRIEKFFGISLTETLETYNNQSSSKSETVTMADMIKG